MENNRRRLLHFLHRYKICIVLISGPFIIIESGYWIVGRGRDTIDNKGGIESEKSGLTTPPRSGWKYYDGTSNVLDDTLLFLPGGLSHALKALDDANETETLYIGGGLII